MPAPVQYAWVLLQVDAPNLPQPLTYRIPPGLKVAIGDAVLAPLGPSREVIGYVVRIADACPPEMASKIKEIISRIDGASCFDEELWEAARYAQHLTLCEYKDVLKLIAPELSAARLVTTISLADGWEEAARGVRSEVSRTLLDKLCVAAGGSMEAQALVADDREARAAVSGLRRKGVVRVERTLAHPKVRAKTVRLLRLCVDREVALAEAERLGRRSTSRQARLLMELIAFEESRSSVPAAGIAIEAGWAPAAKSLADKGFATYHEVVMRRDPYGLRPTASTAPPLSDEQQAACRAIGSALSECAFKVFLLYGITGSGKTEVYLDAIARTIAAGKSALVLLPEIGLSAQVLDLMKARFGDTVAVLHSALSAGERFDEWQRIRRGEARIVVGARSAVYAPLTNLGLVIVDEEHEPAYKQDSTPRYHARDIALFRAKQAGAAAVLGSATPSLESFYRAREGKYELLTLAKRVESRPLPPVILVDLRAEKEARRALGPLSPQLTDALAARLAANEQSILFLNRRGFAPFLLCRDCGLTLKCVHCDVTLSYHRGARLLQCHHCDYRRDVPDQCPKCRGARLLPFGVGTEKVEEAVKEAFPDARTVRMDRDTTVRKGSHAEILRTFRRGGADVLIGTQMVAKGLDFPNVTLVGVINADTAINLPDYHASERSFQILTQVAGRAGRGALPGEVLVQTFDPDNVSIRLAAGHDFIGFYDHEIAQRLELSYPPFAHLANVVCADEKEHAAVARIERTASALRTQIAAASDAAQATAMVLGPVACPLARLRGRYRWHLMLRCAKRPALLALLSGALKQLGASDRLGLTLDIDPTTML